MDPESDGTILGQLIRPLERVGVYVPGGRAAYPSSVLMNVIPARVAGVEEIAMVTPPLPDGSIHSPTLVAAREAGATEIWKVGGAQGIAALAYGTESIPAGGQDRRPRQHLRRLGEAAGVRHGGHRHDRRAERNRRHRRRNGRSRICGRRPPFPGGTRSDGQRRADHPLFRLGRTGFPGTGQTVRRSGAEGDRRPIPPGSRGDLSRRRIWRRRWRWPTGWPPSIWS